MKPLTTPNASNASNAPNNPYKEKPMANGQWLKAVKVLRSPKAPQNLLINQVVFLRAEAWERCTCTYAVASLGYNLVNIHLWSRIARNHILFHNAFEILKVKLFCLFSEYELPQQASQSRE